MFPDVGQVLAFFSPSKWPDSLEQSAHSLLCSTVTLRLLDRLYHPYTAKTLVKNNMRGIYSLAAPKEQLDENALEMTAALFVAKFGHELSVFATLYFFAKFLTDYKTTYTRFDLQEILRQCEKSFLPVWRSSVVRAEQQEAQQDDNRPRGRTALYDYLRREYIDKGKDPHDSGPYRMGFITDKEIQNL